MFIGYFTERPYQARDKAWYRGGVHDLQTSNGEYDPRLGAQLYNRYLDEKVSSRRWVSMASCSTSTTPPRSAWAAC